MCSNETSVAPAPFSRPPLLFAVVFLAVGGQHPARRGLVPHADARQLRGHQRAALQALHGHGRGGAQGRPYPHRARTFSTRLGVWLCLVYGWVGMSGRLPNPRATVVGSDRYCTIGVILIPALFKKEKGCANDPFTKC